MLKQTLFSVVAITAIVAYFNVTSSDAAPAQSASTQAQAGKKGSRAVDVETAQVEAIALPQKLTLVANLEAWQAVTISPEVNGRLLELTVRSGDEVKQGQVLAQLDNSQQKAQKAEMSANLKEAQRVLAERQRLADKGVVTSSELASQQSAVVIAQARLESADVELAKYQLQAPFDGVVGLVDHAPGARVTSGEVLMTLDQLARLRLDLAVPQRFLASLQNGQKITMLTDAYPEQTFSGTLTAIDSRVNPESMTVSARFAIDNPGVLKPGMLSRVDFELPALARPVIPVQAMEYSGSDRFVYLVDDNNIAHRTQIEPGTRQGNNIAVESGIEIGDRIVVKGLVSIKDGSQVREAGQGRRSKGEAN